MLASSLLDFSFTKNSGCSGKKQVAILSKKGDKKLDKIDKAAKAKEFCITPARLRAAQGKKRRERKERNVNRKETTPLTSGRTGRRSAATFATKPHKSPLVKENFYNLLEAQKQAKK